MKLNIVVAPDGFAPEYATEGAAGMDLRSAEDAVLEPLSRRLVRTGLRIAVPPGNEAQVRPRSGLALKQGIGIVNSPGTIDCDYRGEIGVILINFSSDVVQIRRGDRIAQMVICPIVRAEIELVEELDSTERGEGGFGSTGNQ